MFEKIPCKNVKNNLIISLLVSLLCLFSKMIGIANRKFRIQKKYIRITNRNCCISGGLFNRVTFSSNQKYKTFIHFIL